jgi:hypothetical protein
MRSILRRWLASLAFSVVFFAPAMRGVTKVHVITFGKSMSVPWIPSGTGDEKPLSLKVRALVVDGRVKEYVLGTPHEVTDRLFVVRRAFRVNDSLPEESGPHWLWQRGGWLLVDRTTGRVSPVNLSDFDAFYSAASWYRDYVAYCGVSDDGRKTVAIVAQLGRRKPVLNKPLSNDGVPDDGVPDSACPAPSWQRSPVRVSFEPASGSKQTFAVHGHVVDVVSDEEEGESSK